MGKLVASRWTGEDTGKKNAEADTSLDNEHQDDLPNVEEYEGYASETDDDNHKYDEEDENEEEYREEEHHDHDLSSSYTDTEPDLAGLSYIIIQICF